MMMPTTATPPTVPPTMAPTSFDFSGSGAGGAVEVTGLDTAELEVEELDLMVEEDGYIKVVRVGSTIIVAVMRGGSLAHPVYVKSTEAVRTPLVVTQVMPLIPEGYSNVLQNGAFDWLMLLRT